MRGPIHNLGGWGYGGVAGLTFLVSKSPAKFAIRSDVMSFCNCCDVATNKRSIKMQSTKETKQLKDVLKFRLEFMLMMLNVGREEEANQMVAKLLEAISQVEGEYKE